MRTAVVCVALAGVVWAEGVGAATVGSIEGDVLINRGDGYRSAKGTLPNVPAGTQLMVRPGGSAIITYSGNCAVRIAAGVWSVNEQAPCADGRDFIDFTGRADRPVLDTRPAPPPVTETASINKSVPDTADVSPPKPAPSPETRAVTPPPAEGIGQPYSTVYRTTAGDAPPPEGEAYRPPPPDESAPPADTPAEEQSGYQSHHYLIMGGLVAAGVGGAAVLLSQGGDDSPASP